MLNEPLNLQAEFFAINGIQLNNFMNKKLAIFFLSTSAAGSNVLAADNDIQKLDDIVITSTGLKQSTSKSARPVTVLTGEELQKKIGTKHPN